LLALQRAIEITCRIQGCIIGYFYIYFKDGMYINLEIWINEDQVEALWLHSDSYHAD
jgi:hypothetical protein